MCKCDPNIRTPYCGKGECVWPNQKKPEGSRENKATEVTATDREAWEKRLKDFAQHVAGLIVSCTDCYFQPDEEDVKEREDFEASLLTDILAIQTQLTEALAEVERLRGESKNLNDRLTEARAQAGKAEQQNMDIRVACGDNGMRNHKSLVEYIRELWHKSIEKARQPK